MLRSVGVAGCFLSYDDSFLRVVLWRVIRGPVEEGLDPVLEEVLVADGAVVEALAESAGGFLVEVAF